MAALRYRGFPTNSEARRMNDQTVESRLREIFAAILEMEPNAITPDLRPESCPKWDSLKQIHIANAIDEEFGIALDFDQQMEIESFGRAIEIVTNSIDQNKESGG